MSPSELFQKDRKYTRAEIAKIAHEYVRDVLNIEDIPSIKEAEYLLDLYDCHVCTQHVAQVFLQGIMKARFERVFDLKDEVTSEEMEEILERLTCLTKDNF